MPEFKRSISQAPKDFTPVRAIDKRGRGDILGQALSDVVQGVAVFGKSSAREAGIEAGQAQAGLDLTLEQVNRESEDIGKLIEQNLASEQEATGGALSSQRVMEIKDKALRSVELTDRHIQSLIDAGTISSTEGNARRRIELSKRMNEGANFLFKDEFVNAMSSVTGGVRGSAASAVFPKTAEELEAEAKQAAQIKAIADHEERITSIQQLYPERSREMINQELREADKSAKRLQELELLTKERELNADENAEQIDLIQANTARAFEVEIGKVLQPNGTIEQGSMLMLNNKIQQSAQAMRDKVATTPNLSRGERKAREEDIRSWMEAQQARVELMSATKFRKELAADVETSTQIFGVNAAPWAALLIKYNPELLKELNTIPFASREDWAKKRLGEAGFTNLESASKYIKNITAYYSGKAVNEWRDPASTIGTDAGKENLKDPAFRSRILQMYKNAPDVTSAQIAKTGFILGKSRTVDPELQSKAIDFLNIYRSDLNHIISQLGGSPINVRVERETRPDGRPVVGGRTRVFVDMPQQLMDSPGAEEAAKNTYKVFENHPWLWQPQYEAADEAFNAYMKGEFTPSMEQELTDLENKDRTFVEESQRKKTEDFVKGQSDAE